MRRVIVLASAIILVVAVVAAHGAKAPKKAFLVSSVTTVDQLANQVIDNATVAARYARHYNMSRNMVVDYFQKNLRIGRLTRDYKATVYYIKDRTDILSETKTLPSGSYVFVTVNGIPVLEGSTGNPLSSSLPTVVTTDTASTSSISSSINESNAVTNPNDGVVTKVLGAHPAELAAVSTAITGMEPAVELISAIPVSATPSAALGASSLRSIVPLAAALGGAAALAGGGGDGARSPAPAATVPEPASLLALAFGVSGIALPAIRRRR